MRSLPLPLALTARLTPVAVLACAGWAMASGPDKTSDSASSGNTSTQQTASQSAGDSPSSSSSSAGATKTYSAAPAPCGSIPAATVKSLVPGAKTAGKEIPSTDTKLRRTCSWNALKGYDYRWLDVSFEIMDTDAAAAKEYKDRVTEKSGGGAVPGLGDSGYSVVNLTTEDKQQTREGVVMAQVSNALVIITYNGSDFETKKAPSTDVINKGAIQAAKAAVTALKGSQ
ncbi:hypothetical protein ACIPX0_35750 [Streptomyces sp. NPDC090075]|uniref:hypothetical protein n=1 Tax=unclassified Streptomyces TaxID=2593676 RepID=UPI0033D66BE1